jgi:hypothetical protein
MFTEERSDDYVAWLRYVHEGERTRIVVCDSDAPGAFKVYRERHSCPCAWCNGPLLHEGPHATWCPWYEQETNTEVA